ncbi:cytochrome d ubiquinol oxidase subunit II [Candidatus Tisiphia endosymbiont of Beris chalybata]|uniref:cytochrome d ubiquinol oxidase subunit II n=1 Tax=Candidatus Tisiphia endosymbiont of Beris chalybata TaxID=3066262 RepID=UPI00312C97F4
MINFSPYLDLPLAWGGIIGIAIFLYVLLDGFDLGIGILFPFAPTDDCRNKIMNSVAPFWDGNETWLVLGGAGLFVAFPLAYSILISAFYIPVIIMLLGLIFRGVAFEFRFKTSAKYRYIWDYSFHFGSIIATFFQGTMLGAFVQGFKVEGRTFAGTVFDFLTPFSIMTGVALMFGYALLGCTWLIMKTDDNTQRWARKCALYVLMYVMLFIGLVSLWVPFLNERIRVLWFTMPNFAYLSVIPILTICTFFMLCTAIWQNKEFQPFLYAILLFILGYLGLSISIWPFIVPHQISLWQAAAIAETQSFMLIGIIILLPVILGYTAFCYYVFRGKSTHHPMY